MTESTGNQSRAHFRNPTGYDFPMVPGTDLFEFTLDQSSPLEWVDDEGATWQPDRHFHTDRGSIPSPVSCLPGFSRNRLAYLFHDSAYRPNDYGHGLFRAAPFSHRFCFRHLTRRGADDIMRRMLISEGVAPSTARVIWAAVRVFGRRW